MLSEAGELASEGVARLLVPACALLLWAVPARAQSADTSQAAPSTAGTRPAAATTGAPAEPSHVEVHFAATEPGVTVYSRPLPLDHATNPAARELPAFQAVCQAPCEAALAPVGRAAIPVAAAFELRGDARMRGEVISHASERRAGWWILGIMGTLGVTSTTIGMFQTCVDDQTCQQWTSLAIWSGFAITAAGALIGLPKIVASDEATLTLIPGVKPLTDPAGARLLDSARSAAIPNGLTLAAHF